MNLRALEYQFTELIYYLLLQSKSFDVDILESVVHVVLLFFQSQSAIMFCASYSNERQKSMYRLFYSATTNWDMLRECSVRPLPVHIEKEIT